MYYRQDARLAIYAEGALGKHSKTAEGVIRYGKNPVVAVIDSSQSGKTLGDVIGIDCDAPIVDSIGASLKLRPDALLLGTAWREGVLPQEWRPDILAAIDGGLDVINGLHDFLADDEEIAALAKRRHRQLLDVRRPPERLPVATGKALGVPAYIVLTVGSDGSVGKMTTALEMVRTAEKRGRKAKFVATGQTGIMIAGEGIAIDRVIGDFMAGATEKLVVEGSPGHEYVFVEGQGSLVHPGWSGVTLAILHGACPHSMVLAHNPNRKKIKDTDFDIPDYGRLIHIYEDMSAAVRPARVIAIALNTRGMSEKAAEAAIAGAEAETGLPATDAVRYGAGKIFDAIVQSQEKSR